MCLLIVVVPYVDRCVTRSKDEGGRAGRQIAPLVSLELGTLDGGLEPPASRGLFEFSKSKLGHVLRGYSHCTEGQAPAKGNFVSQLFRITA